MRKFFMTWFHTARKTVVRMQFKTGYALFALMLAIAAGGINVTDCQAATITLPKTGETICSDTSGNVIACTNTGQDGDLQKGIAWPNPRFTDNGDGTMTDNLTGLVWLKDANCIKTQYPSFNGGTGNGAVNWQSALDFIAGVNNGTYSNCSAGKTDWRMPNINEFLSLINYGSGINNGTGGTYVWLSNQGFNNVGNGYWSSTVDGTRTDSAMGVALAAPAPLLIAGRTNGSFAWPVRGGQGGIITLPKTGQSTSYAVGDDGDLQKGVAWPGQRFTNPDGTTPITGRTVVDQLTGFMWTQDGNAPGPAVCGPGVSKSWQGALDYVACLNTNNYLGYADWRLPNINELTSLINYGQADVAAWLNNQGFSNVSVLRSPYWSSSTSVTVYYPAIVLNFYFTLLGEEYYPKSYAFAVWPMRGTL